MGYIGAGPTRFNTADELTVTGDAQIDTTTLVVDSTNNRVGVGTASPTTALDVTGTVTADGLTIADTAPFINITDTDTGVDHQITGSSGVGNLSIKTDVNNEAADGDFFINTKATNRMRVQGGGDISFYDSSGVTQGLFWDASTQRLGLGTTAPSTKIHLNESGSANAVQRIQAGTNGYAAQLHLYGNNVGGAAYNSVASYVNGDSTPQWEITGPEASAEDQMLFHTGGAERLRITSGGSVGIGQSSPATPLHINGVPGTSTLRLDAGGTLGGARRNWAISAEKYAAGALSIEYGSTEGAAPSNAAMTIDSSGRVGIGTTSPASYSSGGSNLVVANSNSGANAVGMSLVNPNGAVGTSVSLDFVPNSNIALASISSPRTAANGATDLAFNTYTGSSMTEKFRITSGVSGGQVRIGTFGAFGGGNAYLGVHVNSTTKAMVTETGDTSGRSHFSFRNGNGEVGGIDTGGSSTFYNTSSDYRLKENVADMTGAIDRVKALAPKRFNFIADDTVTVDGFLAHEAQAVVPEAVKGTHNEVDDDGNPVMQGIDQSKLVPLLTGALREAIAKIEALETRIEALESA
jgi:hypothetical protein